jgi:hydroxymethylbilane synthase
MAEARLVIGSRGSKLALHQANWVKTGLQNLFPYLDVEIRIIKTSGDVLADAPLNKIGGKGLFTKEIEEALLGHRVDLAVHSLKDLPTVLPEGLALATITRREDARDALLSTRYRNLDELPEGARVGTSSLRRQSQLLHFRGDLKIQNLRGNIDTRLRKLDEGQFEGIILACAGLIRLGYSDRITETIPVERLCPAVGQGALGIETRQADAFTLEKVQRLDHAETHIAVAAERAFLKRLGGGCQVPIAGYARVENQILQMLGVIASPDGKQLFRDIQETKVSSSESAAIAGVQMAERMLSAGAQAIVVPS